MFKRDYDKMKILAVLQKTHLRRINYSAYRTTPERVIYQQFYFTGIYVGIEKNNNKNNKKTHTEKPLSVLLYYPITSFYKGVN